MFYGSILFKLVGVIVIWLLKSLFSLRIISFNHIWKGDESNKSDDLADHLSSETIQIFIGFITILIITFWTTGIFNQMW
jgi:cytosine/uracil/thiamine/allantoin permease